MISKTIFLGLSTAQKGWLGSFKTVSLHKTAFVSNIFFSKTLTYQNQTEISVSLKCQKDELGKFIKICPYCFPK